MLVDMTTKLVTKLAVQEMKYHEQLDIAVDNLGNVCNCEHERISISEIETNEIIDNFNRRN